ncbi:Serine-threonine/tyrosine-protein kinase, catalytic domain [Sesbania bispinosa]|nr:Serine-threonine/tyrosine-protein kinase, catalytic domain [Sesbania bispinosa]
MGFNRDRLVWEGASAKVYKRSLPFGGDVAVKRFERADDLDCLHNPFATEFATMVGYLRHKNLFQFKGWFCEGNELVPVYEYLPNGSLDKVLHRNFNSSSVLSWKQRVNIVLGVASALTYLHEECERQIIHSDVNTCNIMLDADFNAKLGGFGLVEVYEHSSITRDATIPAGTMGYLAPEYVYTGVPTVKTDVYSFGVVMIEVETGRKPVQDDGSGTVVGDYVWNLWEKNKLIEVSDPRLMGKFDTLEMERMLLVGLLCVHRDHDMALVVHDFGHEALQIMFEEVKCTRFPNMVDTWLGPTFCNSLPLTFSTSNRILSSPSSSMAFFPSSQQRHHRRCNSNPNPNPTQPQPALLVFSGGTAFNGVVEELKNFTTRVAHVLPVSDDGGSTAEIVRVLGGPAVGDIRSRCLRLSDQSTAEALAVRNLLGHRLPIDPLQAKSEWCVKTLQGDYSSFSGLFPESGDFYKQTEAISDYFSIAS